MKTITPPKLKILLDQGKVSLIDVREPNEYKTEHIENSYLVPLSQITPAKLPSRTKAIVLYCRIGKRSRDACKSLSLQDPELDLYSLEGGILAWKNEGFEVQKA
jgi:rhodanese-related sulfurtransferase